MKKSLVAAMFAVMMISLVGCSKASEPKTIETTEVVEEVTEEATETTETETEEAIETEAPAEEPVAEEPAVEEPASPYSYTELSQTMYAQSTVNVRDLPEQTGAKLGSLTTNQEVTVTGQCNETGWYKISYNGGEGFVSNSYLGSEKVAVKSKSKSSSATQTPAQEAPAAQPEVQPGQLDGNGLVTEEGQLGYGETLTPDSYHCWYCEEVFPTVDEMKAHTLAAHGVELP